MAALPPPFQPIVSQASSAAKAAPIAQHAQAQTAAAVIARRVHQDWQIPATLLMRVSLLLAAQVTREAQALRELRVQVFQVNCSLEH